MRFTLTLRDHHRSQLESCLFRYSDREGAAYLVCGVARIPQDPWTGSGNWRLFVRDVVPVNEIVSQSATHVTWKTDDYIRLVADCEREGNTLLIAHNHVTAVDCFSEIDDENEKRLFPYALDKLGDDAIVGSVLMRADRSLTARVWMDNPLRSEKVELISTIGKTWHFESSCAKERGRETLHRQELALGPKFNDTLSDLRIGIVGCGATGSAAAMLLARLGVGSIVLFDADIVDVTNLHRLHGATQSDADAGRKKAEVLRDAIAALGLGCKLRVVTEFVESDGARDSLRSCDIIFACTDDHLGRAVLNRLAYFYLIPVIDVGVVLRLHDNSRVLSHVDGRVTVLQPDTPCLLCREVLNPRKIAGDAARRGDPQAYERLKAEGYIIGGGEPSPAVITFTTETASMGVTELIQRLTQFRGEKGNANQRHRHFLDGEDSTGGDASQAACRICGRSNQWGRGDCEPFLEMSL